MSARIWIDAARPKTLGASIAPVALGTALASRDGGCNASIAIVTLLAALAIQVGTNFCNDYCDYLKGADANRVGPVRATQAGLVSPEAMKRAAILAFLVAIALGVVLVQRGGAPILIIGMLSVLFGVLYTAGPYPLAYIGLGDLFVVIFFGPVAVAGTYYLQALTWSLDAVLVGLIPGLMSVAILVVNNLRDRDSDAVSGKKTLVVLLGERFGRCEYALCLLGPIILTVYYQDALGLIGALIVQSALVVGGFILTLGVWGSRGSELNRFLPATNILLLLASLLISLFLVRPL